MEGADATAATKKRVASHLTREQRAAFNVAVREAKAAEGEGDVAAALRA
jgi:hypothetical protein